MNGLAYAGMSLADENEGLGATVVGTALEWCYVAQSLVALVGGWWVGEILLANAVSVSLERY